MQMKRSQFFSWLVAGLCACASAVAAEALPPSLRACMSESDPTQRLACFDRESAQLAQESAPVARRADPPPASAAPAAAATAATAAPVIAAPTAAAPAPSAEDKFGVRGSIDKKEAEEKLTAKVSELGTMPHGELRLTLDNGQVWQQKSGDRAMRIKVGDDVTIRRASLGSFLLTSAAANGSMRVARVK